MGSYFNVLNINGNVWAVNDILIDYIYTHTHTHINVPANPLISVE